MRVRAAGQDGASLAVRLTWLTALRLVVLTIFLIVSAAMYLGGFTPGGFSSIVGLLTIAAAYGAAGIYAVFLRMKRAVSLLVSDRDSDGRGAIVEGTYQSPILVQWRRGARQAMPRRIEARRAGCRRPGYSRRAAHTRRQVRGAHPRCPDQAIARASVRRRPRPQSRRARTQQSSGFS